MPLNDRLSGRLVARGTRWLWQMRIKEVLGPPGELKDLASPARRYTRVWTLSPDAAISISPLVRSKHIFGLRTLAYSVDEFSAALLLHSAVLTCSML